MGLRVMVYGVGLVQKESHCPQALHEARLRLAGEGCAGEAGAGGSLRGAEIARGAAPSRALSTALRKS